MKILLVDGSNYVDFPPGGIKFYTRNFVKALDVRHSVDLVGLTTSRGEKVGKWSFRTFDNKKVPFLPVCFIDITKGFNDKPLVPIRIATAIGLLFRKKVINLSNYDFIYIHFPELMIPFIYSKKQTKIVFHLHGTIREAVTQSRYKWITNSLFAEWFVRMNKWVIDKSDLVFAVSQEGLDLVTSISRGQINKFKRIPVMVDADIFRPSNDRDMLRKKHGFNPDEKIIIFTGRTEPKKQIDMLIEYTAHLSKEIDNLKLIIAGSGSDYDRLKKMSRDMNVADSVSFLGEVEHNKELPELLACSDVYAFTSSRGEGFPASIVEALACGVPVLSHDLGDISKVIINGKTGYLLDYGDFQDFKNKLQLVFNNREELSRNSYVQAQEYSVENVTNMICKAMEEVIR